MDKRKLIKTIASRFDLEETGVSVFVDSIFDSISSALRKGKSINIPEFGKFIVNKKTVNGEKQGFITFSPSKKFADEINKNYSDLNPAVIKMMFPAAGSEIEIKEVLYEYGDEDYSYITFEDETDTFTEPELISAPEVIETVQKEVHEPPPVQPGPESVKELSDDTTAEVPYLIPLAGGTQTPPADEKETDVRYTEDAEIKSYEEEKVEDEVTESSANIFTLIFDARLKKSNYLDVIGEQISAEKEIILKDIEEYLLKEKTEKAKEEDTGNILAGGPESPAEVDSIYDNNYFSQKNVIGFETENEPPVFEDSDIILNKTQNVFVYDTPDIDYGTEEKEKDADHEIGQNVFLDLENFFNKNDEEFENAETMEVLAEEDKEIEIQPDAGKDKEEHPVITDDVTREEIHYKHISSLKDDIDTLTLEEEILQMLLSREKTISELNKYGLDIAEDRAPQNGGDTGKNISENVESKTLKDSASPEEIISEEISYDDGKTDTNPEPVISETPGTSEADLYEELNKRLLELEELSAAKDIISEEARKSLLNPEMMIFDKLIEEKPPAEKEIPAKPFPQIVIHDPGSKSVYREPKSLTDAFQNVQLDGIIEHLEIKNQGDDIKSYDDVFKPADLPFIPKPNPELDFKKPRKWLKYSLYGIFFLLFTLMSFFLYKSLLTPSKTTQYVDTTGIKRYDSIVSGLTLVDTSLTKGSIILSEFEIEREGDIIYRQVNEGFEIQISKFDNYPDALKYITNLKDKRIDAKIERIDLPMNKTDYRIIIGPFESLQDAKTYFSNSKMLLNYIRIYTPSNIKVFF